MLLLGELANHGPHLHVALDLERLELIRRTVSYFSPNLTVLSLPAWDCLPYDRVSPHVAIQAQRVATLCALAASNDDEPLLVLTTVNSVLQRLVGRKRMLDASFEVRTKGELDTVAFAGYLVANGYARTGTVREPGEFAVRGGIMDVFPANYDSPVRLDLAGNNVETIRTFDPLSQISQQKCSGISFLPLGEVPLDEISVNRFRDKYRQRFGTLGTQDLIYSSISEGRKHVGMEHWLPLFCEKLETIFDYMATASITTDHLAEDALLLRSQTIDEHYQLRFENSERGADVERSSRPLPRDYLYLEHKEWLENIRTRWYGVLTPFTVQDDNRDVISFGGGKGRDFLPERMHAGEDLLGQVKQHLVTVKGQGKKIAIAAHTAGSRDRLMSLLQERDLCNVVRVDTWFDVLRRDNSEIAMLVLPIEQGFEFDHLVVISEQDILGDRFTNRPRTKSRKADAFIAEASSLSAGDVVVHIDHGIGRYEGLQTVTVGSAPHDCLLLTYAAGDRLYIPVENIEVLSRYGSEESTASLDRLGSGGWQVRKARLKKRLKDMAEQLIDVAAARLNRPAHRYQVSRGFFDDFNARFPYDLTEDQERSVEDVLKDMGSGIPMDRLICGDVGFGKTEVALRAAFVAVMEGKQVAMVTPTTLLSRQHYRTFAERFDGYPVNIRMLSRLTKSGEQEEIKRGMSDGTLDIVIGTHAILSESMRLRDLGLLIVDEEQHFGVKHKERIKSLKNSVHVLTMTATPIPRTLQMALNGLRELSLIATPPIDRLTVRTFIMPFDEITVREAIMREFLRGGQCFYVCPRVRDLPYAEAFLKDHVPEVSFAVAHGRMTPSGLENVMQSFYAGKVDVLISTNIVESGLDIPAANTLIVHRADQFGLAQLYQLRGRIGRSKLRAYAYFTTVPKRTVTSQAQKRLEVMQTLDHLGAGFSLASHDLDIRGAGNLLGEEQSGHIREVGFELYQQLLEEALASARDDLSETDSGIIRQGWSPQINLGMPVLIPQSYVEDLDARLGLYKRVSKLEEEQEIHAFAVELSDRFGAIPTEVENLLQVIAIKGLCRNAGVEKVEAGPRGATLSFRSNKFSNPHGLVEYISSQSSSIKLGPDHRLVFRAKWPHAVDRVKGVRNLMSNLVTIVENNTT